ncbi:FadR/GntR family transcriptional regulator [Acidisphaera sp. L21]|uniref:FadR/GntR family transcriptional regulator n=1 Tax=Acidisphaera sp. L21 TaxID=1641851 RepID=UPI00131E0C8D|nr:FadR/GntR family transcriptional regulator [Acidisphaera sp. L21]
MVAITRAKETEQPGFDGVFAALREHLLSGQVKAGDRLLGERELSAQLGVSRPVLREALRALAMLGVVEIRQGAGTIVRRPDVSMLGSFFAFTAHHHDSLVDDVMQARIAIECQSIRLACSRATMTDLEQLRSVVSQIAETIDDPVAGGLADHSFHNALVAAAHSETLSTLYGAISGLLLRSHRDRRESVFGTEDGRFYLVDHHRLIFEALAAADPRRADDILREHFAIGDEYRRRDVATGPRPKPRDTTL